MKKNHIHIKDLSKMDCPLPPEPDDWEKEYEPREGTQNFCCTHEWKETTEVLKMHGADYHVKKVSCQLHCKLEFFEYEGNRHLTIESLSEWIRQRKKGDLDHSEDECKEIDYYWNFYDG